MKCESRHFKANTADFMKGRSKHCHQESLIWSFQTQILFQNDKRSTDAAAASDRCAGALCRYAHMDSLFLVCFCAQHQSDQCLRAAGLFYYIGCSSFVTAGICSRPSNLYAPLSTCADLASTSHLDSVNTDKKC